MSTQEICRDASITPADVKAGSSQSSRHYDFSFAFGNLQFSDCTLRIVTEDAPPAAPRDPSPDAQAQAEAHSLPVEEVPVSTIVLVAKSLYFRKMFMGSFREGSGNNVAEIRVTGEEKPFFMDLIRFIYTGSLPKDVSSSFRSALKLLIIADRFDTPDCVAECSGVLDSYVSKLETPDALMLLSLPESLQQLPNLSASMAAARASLVKEFGTVLANPGDASFLQLPEAGVAVLLAAHNLKLSSEDVIVRAALAWVCHHFADPKDRLDVLFRLALPNVRFQCVSPKQVLQVCSFLKDPGSWSVCHFLSSDAVQVPAGGGGGGGGAVSTSAPAPSSAAPATTPPVQSLVPFTEISPSESIDSLRTHLSSWSIAEGASSAQDIRSMPLSSFGADKDKADMVAEKLDALTSALVLVSEHALMHGGTIPRGTSLESCLTGRGLRLPPRLSCRPPCSIFLDIPEKLCRDWQTSPEHLATSAPTCASGRWFTLQAKIYPSESTLHVQLSCDKRFPGGDFSSFQIELQLCLQTSDSRPAYLQQTRKALCRYTSASASFGCRDFLGKPLAAALDQAGLYFPEGALRLRADVWLVDAEA